MTIFFNWCKQHKDMLVLFAVLIVAAVAHGYNMFHYPYYENDEGTYMSQAWSVLTQGTLAPYTYWYDHAPAGWLLIALWNLLTGGFFTFGVSINSGRVLMLILHVASTAFLFLITKRLTKSSLAATIAALLFSLSPLGIMYQRRVLLDNIMVFWTLFSLYLLVGPNRKLRHFFASAVTFAIAMLSKESAVFFLPVFLYIVYEQAHQSHRRIAIIKWFTVCCAVTSLYFLYALVKGEFFPEGTVLGGSNPHVSLLGAFQYQASRGGEFFLSPNSSFAINFSSWLHGSTSDPILIIGGAIATAIVFVVGIKNKPFRFMALLSLTYWLFLIRGGNIIFFYVIPLIPLLALNIAIVIKLVVDFAGRIPRFGSILKSLAVLCLLLPFGISYASHTSIYTQDQTKDQVAAIQWVQKNISNNAVIIMDDSAYVDLHGKFSVSVSSYSEAEWYWKVDLDPQITKILRDDWTSIDYIIVSDQLKYDMNHSNLKLVKDAYAHSVVLKEFDNGSGWPIQIRKVVKSDNLKTSWTSYSLSFISQQGEVSDGEKTTSEAQSYALLRSAWIGDKTTYDAVLEWTLTHLQHTNDGLFSWLYGKKASGANGVLDSGAASDADQDIALSLVLASREWNDSHYLDLAKPIIDSIWNKEVAKINGHYYITASGSSKRPDGYLINPSYISPAAYRIFAQVDPSHPWGKLASDSYVFLNELATMPGNTTHLPPNEVIVTPKGSIQSAVKYTNSDAGYYGFDAFRVLWRVALDYTWFQTPEATQYLQKVSPFFSTKVSAGQLPGAIINLDGRDIVTSPSLSTDSGMLADLLIADKPEADKLYSSIYNSSYNQQGYWGDKTNYYDQNWAWFSTALYLNRLSDFSSK